MPLPTPRKGQDQNAFMQKCMGNETIKKDFPDQKQRIAVCLSQFKRKKAKAASANFDDSVDFDIDDFDGESYILY